jgi:hypothetical protein
MKTAGRAFGFPQYADAITQTGSGRYVVDDPAMRAEMMKLRKDPTANAVMGGVVTQQNAAVLASRIGRKPTEGELYVAHFFGPYAGAKVIQLAASNPDANAAAMFPAAARANQSIFYDRQGNARTVAGVHNELIRRYQVAKARPTPGMAVAAAAPATDVPQVARSRVAPVSASARMQVARAPVADTAAITSAYAEARTRPVVPQTLPVVPQTPPAAPVAQSSSQSSQSVFHSLFETDERRGAAVSPVVADLWTTPRDQTGKAPANQTPANQMPTNQMPTSQMPTPAERVPGAPLDLFQELAPTPRSLFKGRS